MKDTARSRPRRWLGPATVIGLVLGGAVAGFGTPAQAVPGATVVSTPSGFDSQAKSAVAVCPAGTVVYGTGGKILNGGGKVTISDMVPHQDLSGVRVQGAENDAYGAAWAVVAIAICGPDNGHNLRRVEVASAANGSNVSPRSAYAYCDVGETLFGTGFRLVNANGNVLIAEVEPDSALTFVEVEGRADNGFTGNWDLYAYAICGDAAGSTVQLVSATSASGAASSHEAETGACPQGTVTGIGGKVTDNVDGVLQDRFDVNAALTKTKATARDNALAGAVYDETAFAICST